MLINSKEYFKHSGVKGMKWGQSGSDGSGAAGGGDDETEQEEQERMLRNKQTQLKNDEDMKNGKKPTGEYEDSPIEKVKRKQQVKQQNIENVKLKISEITTKVKSVSSSAIKKGKAFVDSLFD